MSPARVYHLLEYISPVRVYITC